VNDELPRPELRELLPPEGAYDRVVHRARNRRLARALSAAGALGLVVLVAAAVVVSGGDGSKGVLATAADPESTTTAAAVPVAPGSARNPQRTSPGVTEATEPTPPTTATSSTPEPPYVEPVHRGIAVDEAGNPVAGVNVYRDTNTPDELVAVTGADGSYEVLCQDHTLVLWGPGPDDGAPPFHWAPSVVGEVAPNDSVSPPPCSSDPSDPPVVTTMRRGATITGLLLDDLGQPLRNYQPRRGISATGPWFTMFIGPTDGDGRYWIHGAPAGELRMADPMAIPTDQVTFVAAAGDVVAIDWVFSEDQALNGPKVPGTPP
jgi:hypothetical protein